MYLKKTFILFAAALVMITIFYSVLLAQKANIVKKLASVAELRLEKDCGFDVTIKAIDSGDLNNFVLSEVSVKRNQKMLFSCDKIDINLTPAELIKAFLNKRFLNDITIFKKIRLVSPIFYTYQNTELEKQQVDVGVFLQKWPGFFEDHKVLSVEIYNGKIVFGSLGNVSLEKLAGKILLKKETITINNFSGLLNDQMTKFAVNHFSVNLDDMNTIDFKALFKNIKTDMFLSSKNAKVDLKIYNKDNKVIIIGKTNFDKNKIGYFKAAYDSNENRLAGSLLLRQPAFFMYTFSVDFNTKKFVFTPVLSNGKFVLQVDFLNMLSPVIEIELKHVVIGNSDIAAKILANLEISKDFSSVKGNMATLNTIVNLIPLDDFSCTFRINKECLEIQELWWGKDIFILGKIYKKEEPYLELIAKFYDTDLDKIIKLFSSDNKQGFKGTFSGFVALSGDIDNITSQGTLYFNNGNINFLDFEKATLNFIGQHSLITLYNTKFYRKDGYRDLEGVLDFKNINKPNFFEKVEVSSWYFADEQDYYEARMENVAGKDFSMKLKSKKDKTSLSGVDERDKSTVGFEYDVKNSNKIKVDVNEYEEVLSLEHKVKF